MSDTSSHPIDIVICGIDELPRFSTTGITHVLSILDPEWPVPDAFGTYGEHAKLELRFHDVIDDVTKDKAPEREHVEAVLAFGRDLQEEEDPRLLIHCHAGISRSTAAACLIMAQAEPDRAPADIIDEIVSIRPNAWPNLRMIEMGDELLGRKGALVAAVRDRHRAVVKARPEIGKFMRDSGRHRELDGL